MKNVDALLVLKASVGEFRDLSDNHNIESTNVYLCRQNGVYRFVLRGNGLLLATPKSRNLYTEENFTIIMNGNFFSSTNVTNVLSAGLGLKILHEKPNDSLFSTFAVHTGLGTDTTVSTCIAKTDQSEWYSFVIENTGNITVYRNNYVIASGTGYSSVHPEDILNIRLFEGFNGIIDEISVYSGAADNETIAALINSTVLNYSKPAYIMSIDTDNEYIEREMLKETLSPSAVPSIFDDFDYNDISSGANGYDAVIANTRIHTKGILPVTPYGNEYSVDLSAIYDIAPVAKDSIEVCLPYALQDDIAIIYTTYIEFYRGDIAGKIKYSPKLDTNEETIEIITLVYEDTCYKHYFGMEAYLEKPVQIGCVDTYNRPVALAKFRGNGIEAKISVIDRTNNMIISDSYSVLFFTYENSEINTISDISYINFFTDQIPSKLEMEIIYYNGTQGVLKVIPKTSDDIDIIYPCNIYIDDQLVYSNVECSNNITYVFTKQATFAIEDIDTETLNNAYELTNQSILYRTTEDGYPIRQAVFSSGTTTGTWPDANYGLMYPVPFKLSAEIYNTSINNLTDDLVYVDLDVLPELDHIKDNIPFYSDKVSLPLSFISV